MMLVFLPLQFSWAVVADYCVHETGAAAKHPGHHDHAEHSHASQDVDPGNKGTDDRTAAPSSSPDCGHCHGSCAGMVDLPVAFEPPALASAPPDLGACPAAEPMPAQPERPQWAALA
jgi:hypothetical protein